MRRRKKGKPPEQVYTKKIIRIGFIGMMLIAASMVTGCISPIPSRNKALAEEKLQEKYGEDFEVTAYKAGNIFSDYFIVQAYSKKYPDLMFLATVDQDGNLGDSYVTKRLCKRISEKISENLKDLDCDHLVYTEASLDTLLTDPDVRLAEFMADGPKNSFGVYLFLDGTDADCANIAEASAGMLTGLEGIRGSLFLYLMDPDGISEVQEYISAHDKLYESFEDMTRENSLGRVDFENTTLGLTEQALKEMAGGWL